MATRGSIYQIVDGVRRAKAFELNGSNSVRAAILQQDGTLGPEFDVPIDSLRSPKDAIDMSTQFMADRFWRLWHAVRAGLQLPPILIEPGNRGSLIKDVGWKL